MRDPAIRSTLAPVLVLTALLAACTVVRVDSDSDPARIESRGLLKGHAAAGIPAEEHLIHVDLFDGTSDGAIAELVIWKLFRFELGVAGASVGVGPFSLGLGVLFYDAKTPAMKSQRRDPAPSGSDESPDAGVRSASASTGEDSDD